MIDVTNLRKSFGKNEVLKGIDIKINKGDVVVVTVNHRLNVLGFLDLSAFGEKYRGSANVGMTDIVAALRWVKENISNFGGDPDCVTIFGQSGGGGKLYEGVDAQHSAHKGQRFEKDIHPFVELYAAPMEDVQVRNRDQQYHYVAPKVTLGVVRGQDAHHIVEHKDQADNKLNVYHSLRE